MLDFDRGLNDYNFHVPPMSEEECVELGVNYSEYISGYDYSTIHEELFTYEWEWV